MDTKHKPASALPYIAALTEIVRADATVVAQVMLGPNSEADAAYLAHAANAYPRLVEALRDVLKAHAGDRLNVRKDFSKMNAQACASRVLHELGETSSTVNPPPIQGGLEKRGNK